MLVLDSDHLTEFQRGTSDSSIKLKERLVAQTDPYGTTIITVEEIMRGWMAAIRRHKDHRKQILAYAKLRQLFRFFATWRVLDWDDPAVNEFERLKADKIRLGTMDLKIASICLANDAVLLTRNTRDFERVPDLRISNWLSS